MSKAYEKALEWMNEAQHRFRLFIWYFDAKGAKLPKKQAVDAVNESWKALRLYEEATDLLRRGDMLEAWNTFESSYNATQRALNVLHKVGVEPPALARNQGVPTQIAWIKQILSNYYYQFQTLYQFYTEFQGYPASVMKDALRHAALVSDYVQMAQREEATDPNAALGRYELALANLMDAILYVHQAAETRRYIKIKT